ncbi:MAG: uncharacterized protein KVP18_000425 [Porospora cf. gigantea A]|nr:MAG: hypothetical protein KVP18_000425 [Porospora cf. gigantea A]
MRGPRGLTPSRPRGGRMTRDAYVLGRVVAAAAVYFAMLPFEKEMQDFLTMPVANTDLKVRPIQGVRLHEIVSRYVHSQGRRGQFMRSLATVRSRKCSLKRCDDVLCTFAHHEPVRERPQFFMCRICSDLHCRQKRCPFAHSEGQLTANTLFLRTMPCLAEARPWKTPGPRSPGLKEEAQCPSKRRCRYFHSIVERRSFPFFERALILATTCQSLACKVITMVNGGHKMVEVARFVASVYTDEERRMGLDYILHVVGFQQRFADVMPIMLRPRANKNVPPEEASVHDTGGTEWHISG